MSMPEPAGILENLIIGSGAASVAAAMALDRLGQRFEVLDVGYDLDAITENDVAGLAQRDPADWDSEVVSRLFPPTSTSTKGVERRMIFGSDHPYRLPEHLKIEFDGCQSEVSHATGGFGNVWGGAMLPYSEHALRSWPVESALLRASYENVLEYVPLSAEHDDLEETFPLFTDRFKVLKRSQQIDSLMSALSARREEGRRLGLTHGRARVAVESGPQPNSCRRCGRCLDGCVYDAMWNPKQLWKKLEKRNQIHKGQYVLEFEERQNEVAVRAICPDSGVTKQWLARKVFLGAGQFGTTRLIARSLKRFDEAIRVADSQYFFFPMLSYRSHTEEVEFTLAEIFVELMNRSVSDNYVHYQIYGRNSIFEQTLRNLAFGLPIGPFARRFYLFQGYLHSEDSGHLELTLRKGTSRDTVTIKGIENPRASAIARKSQALLRSELCRFGLIPPFYLNLVPPGRSFHTGASFPIGGDHPIYSSDTLGRPAGLKRVHVVDAACFPNINASTILMTIMANSDRIVRSALGSS